MIHSPNTVIAKYLKETVDLIRPRLEIKTPKKISLYVGTNINGAPHIGTYLTHTFAFILAQRIQEKFNLPTSIIFGIHDNISFDSKEDDEGNVYHRTYHHALGEKEITKLAEQYYFSYFNELKSITGVSFNLEIYSEKQLTNNFREYFLKTLKYADSVRWCVAPSSGILQVRIPCTKCFYSERDASHTRLTDFSTDHATFSCNCLEHGPYQATIRADNETYIDLNTLYRNVVKEFSMTNSSDTLHIVVKGGDWVYSTETIDWALGVMERTSIEIPMRIFLPQIVTSTGAKLSKTLISEKHESTKNIPEWMADMQSFKEEYPDYLERLLHAAKLMMSDPRHMFRSYSYEEIGRILTED